MKVSPLISITMQIIVWIALLGSVSSFTTIPPTPLASHATTTSTANTKNLSRFGTTLWASDDDTLVSDVPSDPDVSTRTAQQLLKRSVLQLGASYDRGFAATPRVRDKMEGILKDLEGQVPSLPDVSIGMDGMSTSPLEGYWRMIWTTAPDVLVLGINPFVSVGAIYQWFEPPTVTNVIDFLPRLQNLLPMAPNSLVRAQVTTQASTTSQTNRIILNFEKVSIQAQEFLGQDVSQVLPNFGFDLPPLPESLVNSENNNSYFDVSYLDDDMVIIRQNAPGRCFVLVKVEDIDP